MVALAVDHEHGVALDELVLVDGLRFFCRKINQIVFFIAFHQLHEVAALVAELENIVRLADNGIAGITGIVEHERVAKNPEGGGQAGGIGIENGVALDAKRRRLVIGIEPNALQHLLGLAVFTRRSIFRR